MNTIFYIVFRKKGSIIKQFTLPREFISSKGFYYIDEIRVFGPFIFTIRCLKISFIVWRRKISIFGTILAIFMKLLVGAANGGFTLEFKCP